MKRAAPPLTDQLIANTLRAAEPYTMHAPLVARATIQKRYTLKIYKTSETQIRWLLYLKDELAGTGCPG